MGTTGFKPPASGVQPTAQHESNPEKVPHEGAPVARGVDNEAAPYSLRDSISLKSVYDNTYGMLKSRHIKLIGIGGTIDEWPRGGEEGVVAGEALFRRGCGESGLIMGYCCKDGALCINRTRRDKRGPGQLAPHIHVMVD